MAWRPPRAGEVRFLDLSPRRCLMIDGSGAPESEAFTEAMGALYAMAYGLHFRLKKLRAIDRRIGALEGLWGSHLEPATHSLEKVLGDRAGWTWTLLIEVPSETDAGDLESVVSDTRRRRTLPALDRVRLETFDEGRIAETLHVGPYATEPTTIERLHEAIRVAGASPRGRHHEIYLGDPRRAAPEKLRTIIRQSVASAGASPMPR